MEDACAGWWLACVILSRWGATTPVRAERLEPLHRETASLKLAKLRGVTFVNQYVVIKYLGKGANGRVFLCLDMCDTRLYAVKARRAPRPPGLGYRAPRTSLLCALRSARLAWARLVAARQGQAAADGMQHCRGAGSRKRTSVLLI